MVKQVCLACMLLGGLVLAAPAQTSSSQGLDERLSAARGLVDTAPDEALQSAQAILGDLSETDDLHRTEVWIIMANAYSNKGDHVQGMDWAAKAQHLSRVRGLSEQELSARYALINIHRNRGELDDEIRIGIESLALAEELKNERQVMIMANSLGASYTRKGDYDLAIASYQKGYDHALSAGDLEAQAKMLNNLSSLMITLKNFDQALEVMQKGVDLAETQNDKGNVAVMLTNRAYILDELGRKKEQLADLERALQLAREGGLFRVEGAVLANLADFYLSEGKYARAAELARQGLEIAEKSGDMYQSLVGSVTYGQALSHMGRHNEAFLLFKKALDGFTKAKMEAEVIEVTRIMSVAYEAAGLPGQALVFYKLFKEKSDALFQNEKQKAVMDLQEKYKSVQKQKEIEILSRDNQLKSVQLERRQAQRNIILLISISLVLISILVFQRYRITKKSNEQLKVLNVKLNELSLKDTLTGLYNRRYFFSHIENHVAYARRMGEDQRSITGKLAFLIIDIDFFKRINDTLGHHAGDQVLQNMAARLNSVMRESDVLVRWGGEEFLVVARDATDEGARQLAQRFIQAVNEAPFEYQDQAMWITCSVGYCCYPFISRDPDAVPWEKIIHIADHALYRAKNEGRNRVVGVSATRDRVDPADVDLIIGHFEQAIERELAEFT